MKKFVIILFLILIACSDNKNNFYLDLATCEPKGLLNLGTEKITPLRFWVRVFVDMEIAFEQSEFGDAKLSKSSDYCEGIQYYNEGQKKYADCYRKHEIYLDNVKKCFDYARVKCQEHHGRC